ncbi:MAG TPA: hypothetical protein VM658_17505 [bacterium]|nr:hypothetical protein [bacterium]
MVKLYILINRVLDASFSPFAGLDPLWPLAVWSVIMGVIAMVIYKYTSNQGGIKDAKEKIKGHFYEVWLFIDDAPVIVAAQGRIMWNALRYFLYAVPPLAVMIVLFFPLFANLETRYASRPVKPGDEVMVKVRLAGQFEGWRDAVKLEPPPGVSMVGYPVRFIRKTMESQGAREQSRDYEVDYKLRPETAGSHPLKFTVQGRQFTVPLVAGDHYGVRVPPYESAGLGLALLYPPAVGVPADSRVAAIQITYPEADFPWLGLNTWWVWPFLVISMIAAFAVKGVLKVEF